MRSFSGERRIARTSDIGLRRDAQPPMPMVMPSRSSATTSSSVMRLSGITASNSASRLSTKASRASSLTPGQVELEGEALLEAVAALHVDGSMPLSDSLAARITVGLFVGDLRRDAQGGGPQLAGLDDLEHRAEVVQLGRGGGGRRVDHRPHLVLGHQPGQVGGGAERAPVDLGQAEGGVAWRPR